MKVKGRRAMMTLMLIVSLPASSSSHAQLTGHVLNRPSEIGAAIYACWKPPAGSESMALTLVFSFKQNGEILGKPRVSFAKLQGDEDRQRQFVASAFNALKACTPLKLTAPLGGAIAGRPFALRFKVTTPSQRI
jgi:hypothetical protein